MAGNDRISAHFANPFEEEKSRPIEVGVKIERPGPPIWVGADAASAGVTAQSSEQQPAVLADAFEVSGGIGIHAKGGRLAGLFEGDVEVTGDIRLVNADCAEDFDVPDNSLIEPGTVMVLADDGKVCP